MNAWIKSSWCTIALFRMASARKHFSNCTDVVGDQLFVWSFICISPRTLILASNLSRPPYGFSFALKTHFTGITSSAGSAFLFISKVSLSKRPVISYHIAVPHFSLMNEYSIERYVRASGQWDIKNIACRVI